MKKNTLNTLILSLAIVLLASNAFSQALFQNTYTSTTNLKPKFTGPASGSGIIMCGVTDATPSDGFISKTDLNGTVQWTKKIVGSQDDMINVVRPTSDGGYIAVGYTNSSGAGDMDALLIKLDASGTIIWQKTFGTSTDDTGFDVVQTADGGYAVCGLARDEVAVSNKGGIYIFKTTSAGALSWSKMYGEDGWYHGHSIIETNDGGLLVSGTGTGGKLMLIQLSTNGTLQWYRGIMPNNLHTCKSSKVIITADNNYLILLYGDKGTSLNPMISLIKTDFTGVDLWTKNFYFSSYSGAFKGIVQVWNGFLITGNDNGAFFTLNVDNNGSLINAKTSSLISAIEFGGLNIVKLSDGTYSSIGQRNSGILLVKCNWDGITGCYNTNANVTAMTGSMFSNVSGTSWTSSGTTIVNTSTLTATNLSLTKTTLCSSAVGIEDQEAASDISVYPNPFTSEFTIDLGTEMDNVEVKIYDVLAREVYSTSLTSAEKIIIPRGKMKDGIYYYSISNLGKTISTGKIILR